MSERTVQRGLRQLERRHHITQTFGKGGRGKSSRYRICLHEPEKVTSATPFAPGKGDSRDALYDGKGDSRDTLYDAGGVTPVSPFAPGKGDTCDAKGDTGVTRTLEEPECVRDGQAGRPADPIQTISGP